MALYDYEEEIKLQVRSNLAKIALPLIAPLYLLFNILDWISFPWLGLEFLLVRLSILPVAALCWLAIKKDWKGPWHPLAVWLGGLAGSLQMVYMATRTGNLSSSIYLHTINLMGATLLLLFPMPPLFNLVTLAVIYLPPFGLFLVRFLLGAETNLSFSLLALYLGMMVIAGVTATSMDRLRHRNFKQKVSLFYMATTDALTGLKLRRYFFNRFIQELSLRLRKSNDMAMCVALLDVDDFKELNDRYGHQVGDRCLKHIGALIRSNIRIYDVACRFGGEEFAILFPETGLEDTALVCERIRKTVETSPLKVGGREISLSLSAGISGMEAKVSENFRKILMDKNQKFFLIKQMVRILKESDDAMYRSKKKNKNCVTVGKRVDFSTELTEDETNALKSYLPYFEQSIFLLQPEEMEEAGTHPGEEFNFYSEEYFFRRCVEGLYRWHRDPEWREVLAVLSITHPNQELVKKEFHKLFRLADATAILGQNLYAALFYGMPPNVLEKVRARVRRQLVAIPKLQGVEVRMAAAALQFDPVKEMERPKPALAYRDFSERTTELFMILKRHVFAPDEFLFYYGPMVQEKVLAAAGPR